MSDNHSSQYVRNDDAPLADAPQQASGMPMPKDMPPKKKRSKWLAFFVTVGLLLACAAIAGGQLFIEEDHSVPFSSGQDNVMMIDIAGEITAEGDTYNQQFVLGKIKEATNDSDNKGILLMLNTPGGSVYECDEVYLKLMDYKAQTKRPIYAYCKNMCASAGYYIANTADVIYANRNSMVGSIGVINGQFVDASRLLDKLGVSITTVHSGRNKLMGAMSEPPTAEQLAIMQSIGDEYYNRFVDIVAKGRDMSVEEVKVLADGRIYSASQAKNNGLIDKVADLDDMDAFIKKELGDVAFYHEVYEQSGYESLFGSFKSFLETRGLNSELASSVKALEELRITEPKYLYQP